jgi:uncharacterized metal-binding protein YceD (DUF177 family)
MREHPSEQEGRWAWHVPLVVDDVPETGRRLDLVANDKVRAAVARMVGLRDLPRLQASFDVTRQGSGLRVQGRVAATVGQTCVVTLEPLSNEIDEVIDLVFAPQSAVKHDGNGAGAEGRDVAESWNAPEPLIGGTVDLGALATEFLILGLDPYPRKPGAAFQPPSDGPSDEGPFAALAKLKKG